MSPLIVAGLLIWLSTVQAIANSSIASNLTTIRITSRRTRTVTNTRLPGPTAVISAQPTITPGPWLNDTKSLSGPDLATYRNFTYKTLCTYADLKCYNTCMTAVDACKDEHNTWSSSRKSHQSSWATLYNGGVMPMTHTTYTSPALVSTIYNYSTSWDAYLQVTTLPAWAQGTDGYTLTTVVENSSTTTKNVYKSGNVVKTYTSSVPYAVGKTGTPVSTISRSAELRSYEATSWYPYSVPEPQCGPSTFTVCTWSKDCNKCTISGGTVQLLYFPVSVTRPGIAPSSTTSTPPLITSAPRTYVETATYGNYTMTSPSVYISFHTAYAQDECGNQVGQRYPGAILPMKPGELSSVYGGYGTMFSSDPLAPDMRTPYLIAGSLNLADLNWPYPITAYTNQLKYALGREVFSIVTAPYNPVLAVPPEIRDLDPAWASCELDWEGLYDPPVALIKTDVIAGPTTPAQAIPKPTDASQIFRPDAMRPTNAIKGPTEPGQPVALQPTAAINQPTMPVGDYEPAISADHPQSPAPVGAQNLSPSNAHHIGSSNDPRPVVFPNPAPATNIQDPTRVQADTPYPNNDPVSEDQGSSSGVNIGEDGVSNPQATPVAETISAISGGIVVVNGQRTVTVTDAWALVGGVTVSRLSGGGVQVGDGKTISIGGSAVVDGGGSFTTVPTGESDGGSATMSTTGIPAATVASATGGARTLHFSWWILFAGTAMLVL